MQTGDVAASLLQLSLQGMSQENLLMACFNVGRAPSSLCHGASPGCTFLIFVQVQ